MNDSRWGASPEDWRHLISQGVTADLLPVVSNPQAVISQRSKMRDLGKTPSRYNGDREAVGIPNWTQAQSTERECNRWALDGDLGICIQTRSWRAIDIDIADPVRAAEVRELVEMAAGRMHIRMRPNSGKCLLVFQYDGPLNKRIIRTADGLIELLATGQQFIAVGTHPSSVRYEWPLGMPGASFPVVELTLREIDALWSGLMACFGLEQIDTKAAVRPSIPRNADQMYGDAVVGYLVENNWVRAFDRDGRVHVNCPWADSHTTDTSETATSYFPMGVGGFDTGGFRCLHAHCADKHVGNFLSAIGYEASLFEDISGGAEPTPHIGAVGGAGRGLVAQPGVGRALPPFETEEAWPVLARVASGSKKGRIEPSANNTLLMLQRADICGCRIALDQFKQAIFIEWSPALIANQGAAPGQWRTLRDTDYILLQQQLELRGMDAPSAEKIKAGVRAVAEHYAFDSAIQWARGLAWDGVARVDGFFATYFGVEDSPYVRAVGAYLWTALAGRCLQPGIKADMVPVLIGAQGAGKTTAVELLAPEPGAFLEVDLSVRDDNLARSMRGKLVGELGELRGLQSRDGDAIKAWLSRRADEWVPKFVEFATVYPRRIVFVGTGNEAEFLDDSTGERRWLPLQVGQVNVAQLQQDRDQLWAEAVVRFEMEGVEWRQAQDLAVHEHAEFKVGDPWEGPISAWLAADNMDGTDGPARGEGGFTIANVMSGALNMTADKHTTQLQRRVGKVLRALGYEKQQMKADGKKVKLWVKVYGPLWTGRAA